MVSGSGLGVVVVVEDGRDLGRGGDRRRRGGDNGAGEVREAQPWLLRRERVLLGETSLGARLLTGNVPVVRT